MNLVVLDLPEVSRLMSEKGAKRTDTPVLPTTLSIDLVTRAKVRTELDVFGLLLRRNCKVAVVRVDARKQVVTVMFRPHFGHLLIFRAAHRVRLRRIDGARATGTVTVLFGLAARHLTYGRRTVKGHLFPSSDGRKWC
ncbi:hypothetical protein K443DRAFT_13781 [Laccaria amethystina LaAM-08-1]|uniref:Uncharacterized protein n=1 Tax=Laccaria amethystina LaAM-08-1 TaxID=1095629 RepID=A0A0C9WUI6_9AGAR|nr:hypothetical protein K443DRAFT_13781 [Laccaria amethystina LaAM-08-1]